MITNKHEYEINHSLTALTVLGNTAGNKIPAVAGILPSLSLLTSPSLPFP